MSAEKLLILHDYATDMLARLHAIYVKSTGPRAPAFLTEKSFDKIRGVINKKFPELGALEGVPGYDGLVGSNSGPLMEELKPIYDTFVDLVEFNSNVGKVLKEVTQTHPLINFASNATVTSYFLDLVVLFTQCNLLLARINHRFVLAGVYSRVYFAETCSSDPQFGSVAQLFSDLQPRPMMYLKRSLSPISEPLGRCLLELVGNYLHVSDLSTLRKEGALSATLFADRMALPSQDKVQLDLLYKSRMDLWIGYGFVYCPAAFQDANATALLKLYLSGVFVLPLYAHMSFPIHQVYEATFKNFKSKTIKLDKKGNIKALHECLSSAVAGDGLANRIGFRVYVRQSLYKLYMLMRDYPGLLAPKMTMIFAGLSLARTEILTYFTHLKANPPKTKEKFVLERYRSTRMVELIFLVENIVALIRQHRKLIQAYYVEFLHDANRNKLADLCRNITDAGAKPALDNMLSVLSSVSVDDFKAGTNYSFASFRLNWFRAEDALSAAGSANPMLTVKELLDKGRQIALESRYVDNLEELIAEHASLANLWFFREAVTQAFHDGISDQTNPAFSMAFLRVIAQFPMVASDVDPGAKAAIGAQSVKLAKEFLSKLSGHASSLILDLGKAYLRHEGQLDPSNAAHALLIRAEVKLDKNYRAPPVPGLESGPKNFSRQAGLRAKAANAFQLCAALNEFVHITIYNVRFTPREYLSNKLMAGIEKHLMRSVTPGQDDGKSKSGSHPPPIQRPTVLLRQIGVLTVLLKQVENFVDIDTSVLMRELFLKHFSAPALGQVDQAIESAKEEERWGSDDTAGKHISRWYRHLLTKVLHLPGVMYSPIRRSFLASPEAIKAQSKAGLSFDPAIFTDQEELRALARILGPYGLRCIDADVTKFIKRSVSSLKPMLDACKPALSKIAKKYHSDITPYMKGMKELDEFVHATIRIGVALQLRELLHDATADVLKEDVPYIHATIEGVHGQYAPNHALRDEFARVDALASVAGVSGSAMDARLCNALRSVMKESDRDVWLLLPTMFAAAFNSRALGDSGFRPLLEAHDNNAHTLSLCINVLISALAVVCRESGNFVEREDVARHLMTFVETGSSILLRLVTARDAKKGAGPKSLPSLVVFMEQFIHSCELLTSSHLEACVPYSLLRTMYRTLYSMGKGKTKG